MTWRVYVGPSTWVVLLAGLVAAVLLRLAVGGRPKTESTSKAGGAEVPTENMTTGEGPEARVEAILAELKDAASSKGGVPRFMSEFDLAEVFADRFSSVFMAQDGAAGRWYFRLAPGSGKPREAYCEARHACVRMIALLTGASEADVDDKTRLQRWGSVLNVIEIASWDPRLSCRAERSEGWPGESDDDVTLYDERGWIRAPIPGGPVPER